MLTLLSFTVGPGRLAANSSAIPSSAGCAGSSSWDAFARRPCRGKAYTAPGGSGLRSRSSGASGICRCAGRTAHRPSASYRSATCRRCRSRYSNPERRQAPGDTPGPACPGRCRHRIGRAPRPSALRRIERTYGLNDFRLFRPNRIGIEGDRRLHRRHRQ